MKKILFSIIISLQAMMLLAQPWSTFDLQQGEIIHDFTENDLISNLPLNLYGFLEEGKTVYLFFIDATDPECWTYYNSGVLQSFSNDYGSNGQNSVKFLTSIVDWNSSLDVFGISDETMGNWATNATFPILQIFYASIPLKGFGGVYMYRICPDKRVYRTNHLTFAPLSDFPTYDELVAGIGQCELASESIDAKIVFSNTDTVSTCDGEFRPANTYLSNMGFDALQSCDVMAEINGVVVDSVAWSGNLNTYQLDTITFDALPLSGVYSDVRFYAKNLNGTTDQNTTNDTLYRPLQAPTFWNSDTVWVEVNTDGAGYDLYWDIKNSAGTIVAFGGNPYVGDSDGSSNSGGTGGPGPGYYQPDSEHFYTIPLGETPDCYTIRVLSSNGDGATGYFGDFVGFMRFKIGSNIIFDFDDFGRRGYGKFFTADIAPIEVSYAVVNTTNTQANGSITVTASGGLPPYQYSKDCGANFSSSNEFSNLLAGTYCMVTKDAIGQMVTDTVEVQNINDAFFASYAVTHTTNGLANGSITVTASGGVAPYQYSNDCGANFGSSNEFGSLAAGTYCMITKDAIGQTVTDSVVVNSSISATDAPRGLSGLSVRPNPAKDNINIGFVLTQSSNISIEVFNDIGQQVVSVPRQVYTVGHQSVPIDVAALPTGLYFVVLQDERGTSTARFEKR